MPKICKSKNVYKLDFEKNIFSTKNSLLVQCVFKITSFAFSILYRVNMIFLLDTKPNFCHENGGPTYLTVLVLLNFKRHLHENFIFCVKNFSNATHDMICIGQKWWEIGSRSVPRLGKRQFGVSRVPPYVERREKEPFFAPFPFVHSV